MNVSHMYCTGFSYYTTVEEHRFSSVEVLVRCDSFLFALSVQFVTMGQLVPF